MWLGGAIVALILWIASGIVNGQGPDSPAPGDPVAQAVLGQLALWALGFAILSLLLWVTARAATWRAPSDGPTDR